MQSIHSVELIIQTLYETKENVQISRFFKDTSEAVPKDLEFHEFYCTLYICICRLYTDNIFR